MITMDEEQYFVRRLDDQMRVESLLSREHATWGQFMQEEEKGPRAPKAYTSPFRGSPLGRSVQWGAPA